jgi:uncharacterized protein DUF5320
MPRGNRQGPDGAGPMTGRGMGYCAGYNTAGFETAPGGWFGRGMGMGRGQGRGGFRTGLGRGPYGFGFAPQPRGVGFGPAYYDQGNPPPESRDDMLREEIDVLSSRLEALQRELDRTAGDKSASGEDE